jgi:hypothetical protein
LTDKEVSPTEEICKIPGLQIRFNAAVALAHLGNKGTRLDVLKDMLDEQYLLSNFSIRQKSTGVEEPNKSYVVQELVAALGVVADLHRLRPDMDLSSLKPAVDALASSGEPAARIEAEKTQLALNH